MTSITVNLIENFKCKSPWYGFKQPKEKSKRGLREKNRKKQKCKKVKVHLKTFAYAFNAFKNLYFMFHEFCINISKYSWWRVAVGTRLLFRMRLSIEHQTLTYHTHQCWYNKIYRAVLIRTENNIFTYILNVKQGVLCIKWP